MKMYGAIRWIVLGLLFNCSIALSEEAPRDSSNPKRNIESEIGSFAPTHTLLSEVVHDEDGISAGTVDDIVIDPFTGMVVTVVLDPSPTIGLRYRPLIPFRLMAPIRLQRVRAMTTVERIRSGPSIGQRRANARPYRRQLALVPFKYYGLDPVWDQPSNEHDMHDMGVRDDDVLRFASDLRGSRVTNGEGMMVGVIDDLAISFDTGKIAYVVLNVSRDVDSARHVEAQRYAVPLSAFVIPHDEQTNWVLELPVKKIVENEPGGDQTWPTSVGLSWANYIQAKYGDGMLGGAQRRTTEQRQRSANY